MTIRLLLEPQQGMTYAAASAFARRAEALGFDALMTADHLMRIGDPAPVPGPLHAWTLLAGLSRDTTRIRLGTMMSAVTFHNPAVLALMAAQLDHMSGGRFELGLGAGWYEREHQAFGIRFPSTRDRFGRLAEALDVVTRLWGVEAGTEVTYRGAHVELDACPAVATPFQHPHPPLLVGGTGARTTPRLAAHYADEFNIPFSKIDDVRAAVNRLTAACENEGRDPDEIIVSVSLVLCPGYDEADRIRRADDAGEQMSEIENFGAVGSPEHVAEVLHCYREAGVARFYAQINNPEDMAMLDLLDESFRLADLSDP